MDRKTIVITGGTAGIGLAAAQELARAGARLILIGRDAARGDAARRSLDGAGHRFLAADLSLVGELHRVASELRSSEPHIDVLANNAGAWFQRRELTADGFERTFAVNHLAYVGLTLLLKELLLAAGTARVVNTGSFVYRYAKYDASNLQSERRFGTNATYAATKLYNLMTTRALARHWADTPITVNCFSPGFVATGFGRGEGGLLEPYYRFIRLFAVSPARGADTLVFLACSASAAKTSGAYFERRRQIPVEGKIDDVAAHHLLNQTAAMVGSRL